MVKKSWLVLGVIAIFGLVLAACSLQNNPATTSEVMEPASATVTMPALEPAATNISGATGVTTGGNASGDDPVSSAHDPDVQATATSALQVKLELEATDPGSVVLASGDLQLVEFFAFW